MSSNLVWMSAAFVLLAPWGGRVVEALLRRGIGKNIRADEPSSHQAKSGTATMGGLYFLAGIALLAGVQAILGHPEVLLPLGAMLGYGLLGAYDDLRGLKDVSGVGWLARYKFAWQWVLGLILALILYWARPSHPLVLPLSGQVVELGWWSVPLAALLLVLAANAVNLTDGLDGLAGGTSAIAFAAYGLLAALEGQNGLAAFAAISVGALLAFLWHNVHPARLFMGDTGSQALGAGLATVAVLSGHWLLFPLIGLIFLAEALSVMIQVSYFKYTRRKYGEGRRILRMSPLHYHFELGGWSEVQVTLRFWLIALVAAALGIALGRGGR